MATKQLILPANRAFNSNGLAVPGAVARLYESGTTTPAVFYSDEALSTSLGSSITANGAGRFSLTAYQNGDTPFRLIVEDPDGVELDDIDPFFFGTAYFNGTIEDPVNDQPLSQVVSGLQVIWTGGLNFSMSAGTYYIDGVVYTADAQTLTLDAADVTHPRIDVLAVDTDGDFVKVTGTPGANPSEPDVDPVTQLKLKFVLVPAGGTAPTIGSDEIIYEEADGAGEWTPSTTGTAFATGSTSEPDTGTKCIVATSLTNTSTCVLNKGSTLSRDSYDALILRIKSKTANWGTGRLRLHFQNANSQRVGNIVSIEQGTFGFSESNVSTYQQVVIPLTSFNVPAGTLLQRLHITGAGAVFTCHLDNIKLQASSTSVGGGGTSGISQTEGDARYAQRANNLSDLANASTARGNLAAASTSQTAEMIAGFIASPSDKSYTIALKMAHAGTITETTTKSASGTCTATFKVNSTALGGTANSVSSAEQSQAHAATNTFAAGDDIVLTVSSNSSCADMSFSIKYTRTLD